MNHSVDKIRADFDRIARLTENQGGHPIRYESFLLAQLPQPCGRVLDIGCGTGTFSLALAERAGQVVGIDLSPEMVRVAQARNQTPERLEFRCGDFFQLELEPNSFDVVVSVATLHHLELQPALERMKGLLKPGGTLLILDLRADRGWLDRLEFPLAAGLLVLHRLVTTGRLRESPEIRRAWEEHGRGESYLSMPEVNEMCRTRLPGARAVRHLLWRYSVVWLKPGRDLLQP